MEINADSLLEEAKDLALAKHLLERKLADKERALTVFRNVVLVHAEQALAQLEADEDSGDLNIAEARLKDILSLVKSE